MSLFEPRCMVCGAPLDVGAPFHSNPRLSEVCSDECFATYMQNDKSTTEEIAEAAERSEG